ncbi:MAG: NAD(P)H-dependent oxidoreductase subunit E [Alphaproteobacteria bacterium]|nr:NAD(P)H-dependent oxidoreductase subunit E [Alphaproteobacteria bacterium]MCB9796370.1 NAD(P)H-dependent oxidoreductase subunit E [Alphaproteobacteria bacterium]
MSAYKVEGAVGWTEAEQAEIEGILSRYPTKRAAIMPVLWKAQRKHGWLGFKVLRLVAETLELHPSEVLEVASFYTMFKKEPTGKYLIQVCHTLSCALNGADRIVRHIEDKLQIDAHGNSSCGRFTLMRVECLAACGSAPMMQIDDDFYELLTEKKVDEILDAMAADKPLPTPRPEVDQWTYTPVS